MIFQKSYTPPSGFRNELLCCFPTDVSYFASDYEAVMASKESLRLWSHSEWPEDTFTKEENKKDLQFHVDDNSAHCAYGYMLYNPEKTQCLGSIYVNPVESLKKYYTIRDGSNSLLETMDARIDYWIRDCPFERNFELSKAILEWIQVDWNIRAGFTARERMTTRMQVYQKLNLEKKLSLEYKEDKSDLYVFQ